MSWFEKAKTVLIEALDIQDDEAKSSGSPSVSVAAATATPAAAIMAAAAPLSSQPAAVGADKESSDTPTFYDNPHANETVTTPPRGAAPAPLAEAANVKRQSATSDSVDIISLSSPGSPEEHLLRESESSLELLTATTPSELELSPDTESSLPGSIVIIANNAEEADDDDKADADHLNDSTKTIKAFLFGQTQGSGTVAGADSDSTQSFEDIQLQLSQKEKENTGHAAGSGVAQTKADFVDQSYSSTSSDIEIISNPNGGDSSTNSTATRTSPQKFRELSLKASSSASAGGGGKAKGHHREPSEISLLSEDSQAELDKLVNRISELNQVIEAREQRLLQSERQNAELQERNQELLVAVEAVQSRQHNNDATAEAVQRLSGLERKFQASIRERDALRIQIKSLKDELLNKIPKAELTESTEMIVALQSEGEKLSKEILQQSNIIKKLRASQKTSDLLLKKNAEQISSLSSEAERLKKNLAAKEEIERTQIEAVCKMTTEKRRSDEENAELRSQIEDLESKLSALHKSFEGVKGDLLKRTRAEQDQAKAENQEYHQHLVELREKLLNTEQAMVKREQQMREENLQLMRRLEAAELRSETVTQELSITTTPLMRQIESLQQALTQRTTAWFKDEQLLLDRLEDSQTQLRSVQELEAVQKEQLVILRQRVKSLEEKISVINMELETDKIRLREQKVNAELRESDYKRKICQLEEELQNQVLKTGKAEAQIAQLESQLKAATTTTTFNRPSELTEEAVKAANAASSGPAGDLGMGAHKPANVRSSPPLSLVDDNASNDEALGGIIDWQADDLDGMSVSGQQQSGLIQGVHLNFMAPTTTTFEHLQSLLKQRDGELSHLQWELSRQQAERTVLDDEISKLTMELETIKEKLQAHEALENDNEHLKHLYDALLQMYGEKVERTEELEMDLAELKQAYKVQIDELLANPPPNLTGTPKHPGT